MSNKKSRKIFVLDTSVLVYDADAFKFFQNSDVLIPIVVLEELDKVKKLTNDSGKNARVAIRYLDEISNSGDFQKGIEIEDGVCIKIDANDALHIGSDPSYGDNRILGCANRVKKENPDCDVILVSRDINLRVRAKVMGISADNYTEDRNESSDLYSGVQIIQDEDMGAALLSYGELLEDEFDIVGQLYPNECVVITSNNDKVIAVGRKTKDFLKLVSDKEPWGLMAKSPEQKLAIDMIMDAKLPLVSLVGMAGSGKTLLSIACGLELVLNQRKFSTFCIYRPIQSMGNELGHIPGPQPLDAKILTPNGWTTMGQLKIGSNVISRDGRPTKVLGIYPKGTKSVYKITTSDGSTTEACENHLWKTETTDELKNKSFSIKSTKQISNSLDENHYLPKNEAIHFENKNVPIPPYMLGVYLGNDCNNDKSYMAIYTKNNEIFYNIKYEYLEKTKYSTNSIVDELSNLGLSFKKSYEKFIPKQYMYEASISDRTLLLQGLIDANGFTKNGVTSFTTKSKQLAIDTVELVKSLGGKSLIKSDDKIYELTISLPIYMNTKSEIIQNKIISVEYAGEKEVQCIMVENPEHLYITNDYIVTHNTVEEKLQPWFAPIDDAFQYLFSDMMPSKGKSNKDSWKDKLFQYTSNGTISKEALSYIRGRSIQNTLILIDEAQNLSHEEMKAIVTRVGQGSKIIFNGDISQIDAPKLDATSNGLSYLVDKFQKSNLSGHITFKKGERSALATEAAELL